MLLVLLLRCPDPARRCTSRTSSRRSCSRSRSRSRSSRRRSGSTRGVRGSSSGSGGRSSGTSSSCSSSDHRAAGTARAACATDAHRAGKVVSKVVGSGGDHRDGLGGGGASRRLDHPCRLRRDPPRGSCVLLCDLLLDYPCGHRRLLREGGAGGAEETRTPAEGEPLGNEYRAGVGVVGLRTARHGDGRWGTATTTTQGRSEHRARHFC